jgi:thiol-disulfide isomerase/thioredoxin
VGPEVLLLYRDRSLDEVRDVVSARWPSRETGPLGAEAWKVSGCPVNGPAVDAVGDRVATAWFTAAGGAPRVRAALSSDGGRTWSPPLEVDAPTLTGEPLGRVDLALAPDGTAVVSWLRGRGEQADVAVRRIAEGRRGEIRVLGSVPASRAAGVPRIERDQEDFVVAWTVPGEGGGLRAVRVPQGAVAAATALPSEAPPKAAAPTELPDFVGRDLGGREVSLQELRGRVVLVNLWATWCGPCRAELPELARLVAEHGPEGLVVVAVSTDDPEAERLVHSMASELAPGVTVLHAGGERLAAQLGAQALPRSLLYGRDGSLRASFEGRLEIGSAALQQPLRQALAEGQPIP